MNEGLPYNGRLPHCCFLVRHIAFRQERVEDNGSNNVPPISCLPLSLWDKYLRNIANGVRKKYDAYICFRRRWYNTHNTKSGSLCNYRDKEPAAFEPCQKPCHTDLCSVQRHAFRDTCQQCDHIVDSPSQILPHKQLFKHTALAGGAVAQVRKQSFVDIASGYLFFPLVLMARTGKCELDTAAYS